MLIEKMKRNKEVKDNLKNAWYTAMKPLANLVTKIEDRNYDKRVIKYKSISDEELMKKLAKHTVEYLVRYPGTKEQRFIVFNKTSNAMTLDFERRILYKLRNVNSNDDVLNRWHLYNDKANLYYQDDSKEMIEYERKLNKLLKIELTKLGAYAEYEMQTGKDFSKHHPGVYDSWLKRIGYEKTLIVKI